MWLTDHPVSIALVAHAGRFTWDEALMVAAPIAVFAAVLVAANRRAGAIAAQRDAELADGAPEHEQPGGTAEQPADAPTPDGSPDRSVDGPAVDGPAVDGPAVDGPAVDGPVVDGPAVDGPGEMSGTDEVTPR